MRLTTFWSRLESVVGESYASSWADMQVLGGLGNRTVNEALADGMAAKEVWAAVHAYLELPESER